MSLLVRSAVMSILLCFCLAAPALAAPQLELDETGNQMVSGLGGFQVLDKPINQGYGVSVTLSDPAVCADDVYDEEADDGYGAWVDGLGNNEGMKGASVFVEGDGGTGSWATLYQTTISEVQADCSGDYDENDNLVVAGDARAFLTLKFAAPAVRQQLRVRVSGGSVVGSLFSDPQMVFPLFDTRWDWYPSMFHRKPKKKGYTTVIVTADKRLVGVKAHYMVSNSRNENWRRVSSATFKKRGKKAVAQLQRKNSRKDGWSYVCIDYITKFPQLSTGNACPKGPISRARMNELFPGSANGPYS